MKNDKSDQEDSLEGKIKILYVEDNPDDQEILKRLLEKSLEIAYSLQIVNTGVEGLKKIENENYDLMILDYKLPNMTGLDLLEILRKKGLKANVILLTSQTDVRIAADAIKHGALDYVAKNEITENIGNIRNTILEIELLKQTDPKTAKEIVDVYSSSQTVRDHILNTSTHDVNNKLAISDLVSNLRVMMEKKTIACCDSCESFVHMISLRCPECEDHEVRQAEVLQHIPCGTTSMKSEFTNDKGNLVCPKCGKETTSKDTHYKTLGVMNMCANKHKFMKPNFGLICSKCGKEYGLESSKFKTAHSYELKEAINRRIH